MKIVNTKKFIRSIILILGIIFLISLLVSKQSFSYKTTEYKTIYVSSGDTLWSISNYELKNNEYFKDKDIRDIVNNIKIVNNLNNNNIYENQKLKIPVQ